MQSGSNGMTHKSFHIRQDDEFFSRLQSKESTGSSSFRLLYYGGASRAVPFLWEIEPGTPKDIFFCEDSPPPLTPPPAFQYFNTKTDQSMHNMKHTARSKILDTIFPKLSLRKTHVSPSSPSPSPSQSTWSWGSSNYASSSSPLSKNRSFRRRCCFLCPRSSMVFGEDDDGVASFNSRNSMLCFSIRQRKSRESRGYQKVGNVKNALLSIVGHGSLPGNA